MFFKNRNLNLESNKKGLTTGCTYIASIIVIAEYFDKKRGIATGISKQNNEKNSSFKIS
jgi:hypothetical protein